MFYQSEEINVTVFINDEHMPAVTQVDIDFEREIVDSTVDKNKCKYLATITRYLPVGVEVDNLYNLQNFGVIVNDSWISIGMFNCEWTSFKRKVTADGVIEIMTFISSHVQVN